MSLQATASRLLKKFGEVVALSYDLPDNIDPATGELTGSPLPAMVLSGNGYPSQYKLKDVDGTNIKASDIRLIVEKVQQVPLTGWDAYVRTKKYRVMDVQRISQSGVDVIYICQLRAQ